ncbi:MAG: OadG family protein [Synergistaceae bacterium]|nr:OadG family protein [Synergistaceae bacterium]MBQ3347769.1 OadG family protein [Synergistaceae bacterium]MBQ3758158.1 OadG family protein [Synergistaceae bacterium]MBQ6115041.1 OadG family protein [Synergistaceae bacterium]MBR0184632.1 OadG family protein [Synergistaceae bacterium]
MHFEGLSGAINVSVVAFSIVFGVLFVLTGVIYGMRLFAGSGDEKKNDVAPSKPSSPAPMAKPAPVKAQSADKAKIVAAITAAIVEFTGNSNFQILSVQPEVTGIPMDYWTARWKTAGMIGLNSNMLVRKWH